MLRMMLARTVMTTVPQHTTDMTKVVVLVLAMLLPRCLGSHLVHSRNNSTIIDQQNVADTAVVIATAATATALRQITTITVRHPAVVELHHSHAAGTCRHSCYLAPSLILLVAAAMEILANSNMKLVQ